MVIEGILDSLIVNRCFFPLGSSYGMYQTRYADMRKEY